MVLAAQVEADILAGESLAEAIDGTGLKIDAVTLKRAEKSFKPEVVSAAFTAGAPKDGVAVNATAVTSDNVHVIMAIKKVTLPETEPADAAIKGVKSRIARQRGAAEMSALLKAVRNGTDVSINSSRL